jgi:monofunctional biosynthetic peptidoglycan transglycosylase
VVSDPTPLPPPESGEAPGESLLAAGEPGGGAPTRRWWRRALVVAALAAVLFAAFQALTWPAVGKLARENPETTAFLERTRRQLGGGGAAVASIRWVPYDRLSPHLKRAVLVSEDIGFFSHGGFATDELQTALGELLRGERVRGASTITQQLAKNLWLSPSRNPWRKVKEALLTLQLERTLSKRRIFELYLNTAQLGPQEFGAENAARRFFGRSAADLGEREAAALAAGLPSPRRWHPGSGSRARGARSAPGAPGSRSR